MLGNCRQWLAVATRLLSRLLQLEQAPAPAPAPSSLNFVHVAPRAGRPNPRTHTQGGQGRRLKELAGLEIYGPWGRTGAGVLCGPQELSLAHLPIVLKSNRQYRGCGKLASTSKDWEHPSPTAVCWCGFGVGCTRAAYAHLRAG